MTSFLSACFIIIVIVFLSKMVFNLSNVKCTLLAMLVGGAIFVLFNCGYISAVDNLDSKFSHTNQAKSNNLPTGLLPFRLVNSKPLRVVVDSGHSIEKGQDTGCKSAGVDEGIINFEVTKRLVNLLKEGGATVIQTNPKGEFIDLDSRAAMASPQYGDIFISLHSDCAVASAKGYSIHITKSVGGEPVYSLALDIISALKISLNRPPHGQGIINNDLRVTSEAKQGMLSILIEMGFITNKGERQDLQDPKYQDAIAKGIYLGIWNSLENGLLTDRLVK